MPNWKTHIEISKQLNKKLNYNDEEFELFAFGNILPDINNGHLVKDVSKIIDHKITHFVADKKSYINFYNKYKDIIKEPLIMGYYTHLYTDFSFNRNFYEHEEIKKRNNEEHSILRKMKQSDFEVYNNKFYEDTITIEYVDEILNQSRKIEEVSITKEDIIKAKEFLDKQEKYNEDYKFYNEEELDILTEQTINNLRNIIENDTFI